MMGWMIRLSLSHSCLLSFSLAASSPSRTVLHAIGSITTKRLKQADAQQALFDGTSHRPGLVIKPGLPDLANEKSGSPVNLNVK